MSKLTTTLYGAKYYEEESQVVSTIKIWHGIQRWLLKGGDIWADNRWVSLILLIKMN